MPRRVEPSYSRPVIGRTELYDQEQLPDMVFDWSNPNAHSGVSDAEWPADSGPKPMPEITVSGKRLGHTVLTLLSRMQSRAVPPGQT